MIVETLLKSALADAVREGSLSVTFASGQLVRVGDGSGEDLAIRFTDAAAERAMLLDPDLRFGELYMDERLVLERGSIYDLLRLFYANAEERPQPLLSRVVDATRFRLRRLARTNLPGRSRANVAHHYDLDSRLFRLFLDEDMQYSCAWFPHDDATPEEAQDAKKRRLAAKLALAPGQTVLDIGCGWGGLALHLAGRPEAPVVDGVTLSTEQLDTAQRRAAEAGLSERVRVRLEDYRAARGPYDRIVSVGMFEHVGAAFYPTFFRHVARLLKPDGAMLLHTIGSSEAPGFVTPWLDKYIFPGGDIPSLSEIVPAFERAGLVVTDIEVLRLHYALTLREWSRRFHARRQEAAALYDERLCRMWEFYLAAAECAFRHENLVVFQIQLARRARTLPIRRSYMEVQPSSRTIPDEVQISRKGRQVFSDKIIDSSDEKILRRSMNGVPGGIDPKDVQLTMQIKAKFLDIIHHCSYIRRNFIKTILILGFLTGCSSPVIWRDTVSKVQLPSNFLSWPSSVAILHDSRRCLLGEDCQADAESLCRQSGYARATIIASATLRVCHGSRGRPICADRHSLDATACW